MFFSGFYLKCLFDFRLSPMGQAVAKEILLPSNMYLYLIMTCLS